MNPLLRTVIGIRESEEGKISKETVVYLTPEQIGAEAGAHCGACIFFEAELSHCFLTSPSKCDAEHGVCALFLGAVKHKAILQKEGKPLELISKEDAGYVTNAPTHCATCEYFKDKGAATGPCEKVAGTVDSHGCCNGWEEC